jgi:hypothetical protein
MIVGISGGTRENKVITAVTEINPVVAQVAGCSVLGHVSIIGSRRATTTTSTG